jgi:hypothetical protein
MVLESGDALKLEAASANNSKLFRNIWRKKSLTKIKY